MSLSKREKEVISLVYLKYSDIGKILYLSRSTVQGYFAKLLAKYDCHNRIELFLKLLKKGENDVINLGEFTPDGEFKHRKYVIRLERVEDE